MAGTEIRVFKIGEICPNCPSASLGPLALGQTCTGPKEMLFGRDNIDYCGRDTKVPTQSEKILNELLRFADE